MTKSVFALTFALLLSFKAHGQSGSQIVNEAIQDRARVVQLEKSIRELKNQLDKLNDEKNKLDRDTRLEIGSVLSLLQEHQQVGNCRVAIVSQDNAVLMSVVGNKGQSINLTFDPKKLRGADVRMKTEVDGNEGQAEIRAENMKDVFNNETKVFMKIDHRNRMQELRVLSRLDGKDFDTKECRR